MLPTGRGQKLLEAAYVWYAEGVSVVPVRERSKQVAIFWKDFQDQRPTISLIDYWFRAGLTNIAVVCGTGGLLVLDFDDAEYFHLWRSAAGSLAATYTETTSRGFHVFYRVTDDPITKAFEGCEVLGRGHVCNVAPSIHPNGNFYEVYGDPTTPIKTTSTKTLFSFLLSKKTEDKPVSKDSQNHKPTRYIEPDDLISKIKRANPLLPYVADLVGRRYPGDERALPKLSGSGGQWYLCKCPIHPHADKNPSFWVDVDRELWRCFSPQCQGFLGGDVINLAAIANNQSVSEAIRELRKEAQVLA